MRLIGARPEATASYAESPARERPFVHPGTWRPYRRTWRIVGGWVGSAPTPLKPVTFVVAVVLAALAWGTITGILFFVWELRMNAFLFFGRSQVNFSHLSPERHKMCPTCRPASRQRT